MKEIVHCCDRLVEEELKAREQNNLILREIDHSEGSISGKNIRRPNSPNSHQNNIKTDPSD
jgi:hypothetical protein